MRSRSRTRQGPTRALRTLQSSFSNAHDRTDGPLWGLATALPMVGDDVRAVRTVAAVGDDLSAGHARRAGRAVGQRPARPARPTTAGASTSLAVESVAPLVARGAPQPERGGRAPSGGRLDLPDALGATGVLGASAAACTTPTAAMSAADRAVRVLPTMLGQGRTADLPGALRQQRRDPCDRRSSGSLLGDHG